MSILTVPDTRQSKDFNCGTAAMTCVVRFFKSRGTVIADLASPEYGTDPTTIEASFRKAGWKVNSGNRTLAELQSLCNQGIPVIALVTRDGVGHYVVVCGVTSRRTYYHDPLEGMKWLTHADWLERWHDTGRWGEAFREFAIAAWP